MSNRVTWTVLSAFFCLFRGAPPPRNAVGPHPHRLPALASLAPVASGTKPLGSASCRTGLSRSFVAAACPSGWLPLDSGAEQSEPLAGVGAGPHTFAGVGPREQLNNADGRLQVSRQIKKVLEAAGFAPASENTSPQEYYDAYPLLNCRP